MIAPALQQATNKIAGGEAVDSMVGKVAASGGIVGLIFAGIVFLMVYKPGAEPDRPVVGTPGGAPGADQ